MHKGIALLAAALALNLGTSSANMLPQPVTTANGNLSVGLSANLDRLNLNVGLHWMLYENRTATRPKRDGRRRRPRGRRKSKLKRSPSFLFFCARNTQNCALGHFGRLRPYFRYSKAKLTRSS